MVGGDHEVPMQGVKGGTGHWQTNLLHDLNCDTFCPCTTIKVM